jgi:hypothetical protein
MTPLDKILKRSLSISGIEYVVTLSPEALKLTRKGKRLGVELKWADITSGESALATALQASVGRFDLGQVDKSAKSEATPKQTVAVAPRIRSSVRRLRTKRAR